jgi:diguanylate cyclase with GGDEF domain
LVADLCEDTFRALIMIKLRLREAATDAALRPFADEVLALLIEWLAIHKESGDTAMLAALDEHRRALADVVDPEAIPALAGECLETAKSAVARARERQAQQHAELAQFVALVRDTVTVLGGESDDPSQEITSAADRFSELLQISDVAQLKARLTQEVSTLRTLAQERQRQWQEATHRPEDVVARIGGDEFAVLASGLTLRQAESRLRAVQAHVTASLNSTLTVARVTLSCGAAECSAGDTMQSLMMRADQALYDAKRKGKNRVAVKTLPFIRDLLSK